MTHLLRRWRFPLAAFAALCLFPAAAAAQVPLVQNLGQAAVATGFGFNIPITAATHQGDRLILSLSIPGRNVNSVSDTQGNVWTRDSNQVSEAYIYSAPETTALSTADHVHVSVSQGQNGAYRLDEYAGVGTVDAVGSGKSGSGTSSSGPLTTTQPGDLVVSALRSTAAVTGFPANETQLPASSPLYVSANNDAPVGTYGGVWSWPGTNYWIDVQVAYKAAPNPHEYVDGYPLYAAGSWVNSPLPADAPIDPNSAAMAATFTQQIGLNPDGSLAAPAAQLTGDRWDESVAVYVANPADALKTVCSTEVLSNTSWAWMNQLHNAWTTFKAPIPAGGFTNTDGGSDHGVTLYSPGTDQAWDFYEWKGAAPAGTVDPQGRTCDYEAAGGDYQPTVANSPGYFQNQDLGSGVTMSNMWGRRASALPSDAGNITYPEWDSPLPDLGHTLQLIVPCANQGLLHWPATRHDYCTKDGTNGLPEGARVRIDPTYVCPHGTAGSTGPTQLAYDRAYALCATLQKYGATVTDETGGGAAFTFSSVFNGKPVVNSPDGGNCCSANTPPGTGTQWFNWYWDVGLDKAMPHLQVIATSYRPPFAPAQ